MHRAVRTARPWFRGPLWSWRPLVWQGWLLLVLWMLGFASGVTLLADSRWIHPFALLAIVILFAARALKGER